MTETTERATSTTPRQNRRRDRARPRPLRSPAENVTVIVACALSAAAAALSPAHPTDFALADAVWCAALAIIVTFVSWHAKRSAVLWMSGVALAFAPFTPWLGVAAASFATILYASTRRDRTPLLNVIASALAVPALLNLRDVGFHGLPSLVVVAAIAPVLVSAYQVARRKTRKRIRRSLIGVGVALGVALAIFGLIGLTARSHLQAGADHAQKGLDHLAAGKQEQAVAAFESASTEFGSASSNMSEVWPFRVLPVVGQNATAMRIVADSGHDLAVSATTAARKAPYRQLRSGSGQVDLALLDRMAEPSQEAADALRVAKRRLSVAQSPWLLLPVARGVEDLTDQVDRTLPEAELAAEGIAVAPEMLGAETPRHYLVLFANPAEARDLGGFVGGYGELVADKGKVTLTRSGPIDEIADAPGRDQRTLRMSDEYAARYGRFRVARFVQNVTASPDFPTDAEAIRQLYPQAGGSELDGVLYVDPHALGGLLKLTGPIRVPGVEKPLTAANVAQFLLKDQYVDFTRNAERQDYLQAVSKRTFEDLTTKDLPSPVEVGKALGPQVEAGGLLFTSFHKDEQDFLGHLGSTGAFDRPPDGDYLSARTTNAGGNKIDSFLTRSVSYDSTVNAETGKVEAVATVSLTNGAPATGLPDYVIGNTLGLPPGTNASYLSVYSPLDLLGASVGGTAVGVEKQQELGSSVYVLRVDTPPGATSTITLRLSGFIAQSPTYRFTMLHQALVNDDVVNVSIKPSNMEIVAAGSTGLTPTGSSLTANGTLEDDRTYSVSFARRE